MSAGMALVLIVAGNVIYALSDTIRSRAGNGIHNLGFSDGWNLGVAKVGIAAAYVLLAIGIWSLLDAVFK